MKTLNHVPTLDLRRFDTDRDRFVREVGQAYRELGFCCFSHHGIPEELMKAAYEDFRDFFALPEEVKARYRIKGISGARGYTPFKVETAKDRSIADLKEFWHVGREAADPQAMGHLLSNVWPEEVPGFRSHGLALFQAMEAVGNRILASMALNIGLPANFFADYVSRGDSILRALHYPPVKQADLPAVRAGAHEDIDLITLLVGATTSGLELLTRDGQWMPINAAPNTLIVNVGDMLQRLTNHVYRSTTHRVVNPEGDGAQVSRYSMPFFLHPNPDAIIDVLDECVSDGNPSRYPEPITAQEFLMQRLHEIKLAG